jgi:hypothetical protein
VLPPPAGTRESDKRDAVLYRGRERQRENSAPGLTRRVRFEVAQWLSRFFWRPDLSFVRRLRTRRIDLRCTPYNSNRLSLARASFSLPVPTQISALRRQCGKAATWNMDCCKTISELCAFERGFTRQPMPCRPPAAGRPLLALRASALAGASRWLLAARFPEGQATLFWPPSAGRPLLALRASSLAGASRWLVRSAKPFRPRSKHLVCYIANAQLQIAPALPRETL